MNLRTVVTASSVWKFDMDLNRYIRFPRNEMPNPYAQVPYTGEWDDFTHLERMGDRIFVHRPVDWGTGALRMTGAIEWDDLEEVA